MKKFFVLGVALLASTFAVVRWTDDPLPDRASIAARGAESSYSTSSSVAAPGEADPETQPKAAVRTNGVVGEARANLPSSALAAGPALLHAAPAVQAGCAEVGEQQPEDAASVRAPDRPEALAEETAADTAAGLDKAFCYNTRAVLAEAWSIFDVNAQQAVWYSTRRPMQGSTIQDVLLPRLCSGSTAFEAVSKPGFELVAVSATSNARILLGENWVSDGTVRSTITAAEYSRLARMFVTRQRQGLGHGANMAVTKFEKILKGGGFNRMAADEVAAKRATEDLRQAQQGARPGCER